MSLEISLQELVNQFINEKKDGCINYLNDLQRKGVELSFDDFIKVALTCYPEHKWNVKKFDKIDAFKQAGLHLKSKEKSIKASRSFDDILKQINTIEIKDFGELAKYDAAIAFGAATKNLPNKIFMHAGPEKAAKYILGNMYNSAVKYLVKPNRIPYIDANDLPEEFNELRDLPYLIEDCLCFIYHELKIRTTIS